MLYREFLEILPINNIHRFDDVNDWLDAYSSYYPNDDERQEIYKQEGYMEDERTRYDTKIKGSFYERTRTCQTKR